MNVVNFGSNYQIYGEDVQTYKRLPTMSYEVCFNKNTGFFLSSRPDLLINEEKVYGSHERKANKVMNSFKLTDRNFGLILSGQKGAGKSLFARILAQKGIESSMPVILVNDYIPGIEDFIGSIEQEIIVIFDEFEKNFAKPNNEENFDPQEKLLSLFDGMNNGKKLFVITCNKTTSLNEYLMNRPGRFHYHFKINAPTEEEIKEYMHDKLKEEYYPMIERVVNFSKVTNVTYDFLRAMAFEINQGSSFEEMLDDLNINQSNDVEFDLIVTTKSNKIYTANNCTLDPLRDDKRWINAYNMTESYRYLSFLIDMSKVRFVNNNLYINGCDTEIRIDEDDFYEYSGEERKQKIDEWYRDHEVSHIVAKPIVTYNQAGFNKFTF